MSRPNSLIAHSLNGLRDIPCISPRRIGPRKCFKRKKIQQNNGRKKGIGGEQKEFTNVMTEEACLVKPIMG
jgi:hypothetical protein